MGDIFVKNIFLFTTTGRNMLHNFQKVMLFIRKIVYGLSLLIVSVHTVNLHSQLNEYDFTIESTRSTLRDIQFQSLKYQVIRYLESSWCSAKKAELMMDLIFAIRPQVCVEIGVFTGSSLLPVAVTLNYLQTGRIYAIDAWSNSEAVKNMSIHDPSYNWWNHINMEEIKNRFSALIKQWNLNSCCSVIHAPSEDAAQYIPEIDFLHLDGNSCEEGALKDVELFLPKVKSGGYILFSNLFQIIDNKLTKMSALWRLFDECEIICEIDNNTALFRKN